MAAATTSRRVCWTVLWLWRCCCMGVIFICLFGSVFVPFFLVLAASRFYIIHLLTSLRYYVYYVKRSRIIRKRSQRSSEEYAQADTKEQFQKPAAPTSTNQIRKTRLHNGIQRKYVCLCVCIEWMSLNGRDFFGFFSFSIVVKGHSKANDEPLIFIATWIITSSFFREIFRGRMPMRLRVAAPQQLHFSELVGRWMKCTPIRLAAHCSYYTWIECVNVVNLLVSDTVQMKSPHLRPTTLIFILMDVWCQVTSRPDKKHIFIWVKHWLPSNSIETQQLIKPTTLSQWPYMATRTQPTIYSE